MKKIRFELDIDEVVESQGCIQSSHDCFKGEDKAGKLFLFVDRMTGTMQTCLCKKGIVDERSYANIEIFPLPINTKILTTEIIDGKEKADPTHDDIMAHIQDCCDKIREGIVNCQNEVNIYIGQEFDALKAEGIGVGNGISEKTLLSALEIITRQKEK